MSHPHARPEAAGAPAAAPLDLSEKGGPIDGKVQSLDRRLFMSLTVFTGCRSTDAAIKALAGGVDCVVYEEVGDPTGIGVLAMSENPGDFVQKLRRDLQSGPFAEMRIKPEFSMLGRTYSLGYEPRLEDWLIHRPKRVVADPATPWAVWYPLRRTGAFARLPKAEQGQILKEHGIIGRQFGDAGLASDIRLACHGLDKNDNDFVIGLVGKELAPLSQLVETMRPTVQTSQYLESLGPFFVGRAAWRSAKP